MYDILQLNEMLVPELKEIAEQLELKSYKRLSKQDLIYKILDHQAVTGGSNPEEETPAKEAPAAEMKEEKAPEVTEVSKDSIAESNGNGESKEREKPARRRHERSRDRGDRSDRGERRRSPKQEH